MPLDIQEQKYFFLLLFLIENTGIDGSRVWSFQKIQYLAEKDILIHNNPYSMLDF